MRSFFFISVYIHVHKKEILENVNLIIFFNPVTFWGMHIKPHLINYYHLRITHMYTD